MKIEQKNDLLNPTFKCNKKLYRSLFMRIVLRISNKILDLFDALQDKKICGCSLVKYVPSLFRESKGATGSQSTRYCVLKEIFKGEKFTSDDSFIDIGCGKARVIAYLLKTEFPGKISGIELNDDVANFAKKWTYKYDNVSIINGDAFEQNFDSYNIFFLARPFETEFFKKFVEKFEHDLTHPAKLFYWCDQQSGNFLNHRDGWNIHLRKWVFNKRGFYIAHAPQRYSIWTYTPPNYKTH